MTTYYKRRYPAPPFYAIYVQEPEHWRVDHGFAELVVTPGTIPDSLMPALEEVSEEEAVDRLSKNRAWWNETEDSRLRRKWRGLLGDYLIMIVGAAMIVCGVIAVSTSDGPPDSLPYLLIIVVGVVAAAVGEKFVLNLPAVASQPSPLRPIGEKAAPNARMGRGTVCGTILGFVVILVCFAWLVPRMWDLIASPMLFVLLMFCLGFAAAGIGLAVSYTSRKRREVKSKRLLLRLIANGIISGGVIFVVIYVYLVALMARLVMNT